jgi:Flp pilus assembly protein TadG
VKKLMNKRRDKTSVYNQYGQSMIEFGLILPLLVLVVAGIVDLGRAFYASITITNAAREGARFGTLNPSDSQGMYQAAFDELQENVSYSGVKRN